jgi:hypothetical protein
MGIRCANTPIPSLIAAILQVHIATFVTLCEAFMGIDTHFDLWNHFFHVPCPHGPGAEMMVSGGAVIHVMSRHGVHPYFDIPMPRPMNGWWKEWFYLRNDDAAPHPMFIGNRPVPNRTRGMRWPRRTSASCNSCARSSNSYDRRG